MQHEIKWRIRQIFLTVLLGQLFSGIGLLLDDHFAGLMFPLLFGVSVPIANWRSVKYTKWRSVITLGFVSLALFWGTAALAIGMGSIHVVLSFAVIGISGVGFLLLNSAFIDSVRLNVLTAAVTFFLVAISFPVANEVLKLSDHFGFMFSTFMTTLGLCFSPVNLKMK